MMERRSFLGGVLAAFAAPAIVRADNLMRVAAPSLWVPLSTARRIITLDEMTEEMARLVGATVFLSPAAVDGLNRLLSSDWVGVREVTSDPSPTITIRRPARYLTRA